MLKESDLAVDEMMSLALDMGERLLVSGAEVSRVEDTIERICLHCGAEKVDVLTITSSIVVTVYAKEWGHITQTRRVKGFANNMTTVKEINDLSHKICNGIITISQVHGEIERIDNLPTYSFKSLLLIYIVISSSFALFFGGTWLDAAFSGAIGAVICVLQITMKNMNVNNYFSVVLCSVVGGFLAYVLVVLGFDVHPSKINIGNIMLLIPGIVLTNALKDMFNGDLITGLLRFVEAILLSMAIAWGFAFPTMLGGVTL